MASEVEASPAFRRIFLTKKNEIPWSLTWKRLEFQVATLILQMIALNLKDFLGGLEVRSYFYPHLVERLFYERRRWIASKTHPKIPFVK